MKNFTILIILSGLITACGKSASDELTTPNNELKINGYTRERYYEKFEYKFECDKKDTSTTNFLESKILIYPIDDYSSYFLHMNVLIKSDFTFSIGFSNGAGDNKYSYFSMDKHYLISGKWHYDERLIILEGLGIVSPTFGEEKNELHLQLRRKLHGFNDPNFNTEESKNYYWVTDLDIVLTPALVETKDDLNCK